MLTAVKQSSQMELQTFGFVLKYKKVFSLACRKRRQAYYSDNNDYEESHCNLFGPSVSDYSSLKVSSQIPPESLEK